MRVRELTIDPGAVERAFPDLTARECEVLERFATGDSLGETALALRMSMKTVRNHTARILTKLRLIDRTQLVLHARAVLDDQPDQ